MARIYRPRTHQKHFRRGSLGTKTLKFKKPKSFKPVILIGFFLITLTVLAFGQATFASDNLSKSTRLGQKQLQEIVKQTTVKMSQLNFDNTEQVSKSIVILDDLSVQSNKLSLTCQKTQSPIVKVFASSYEKNHQMCLSFTNSAKQIQESINDLIPLAKYQNELKLALGGVTKIHGSPDKSDPVKLQLAWKTGYDSVKEIKPPKSVIIYNQQIVKSINEINLKLTKVNSAPSMTYAELLNADAEISEHYKVLNEAGRDIDAQLITVQSRITSAVNNL